MKIMLVAVNAKYVHSNLAIYSLYSYAKEYKENIVIGEYTINQRTDKILKDIYREKPDVLGFSCYIWNISQIFDVITELHKILPAAKVWLGGPEVSYDAPKVMSKQEAITGIICGEGEQTFYEVATYHLKGEKRIEDIAGIVWRDEENRIVENKIRMPIDLDSIPFPYEQFPEHRIIYYESSRGCPFSCSYCLSSIDKKLRFRSLDLVREELQCFLDARIPQVKFVDRTFNCDNNHALAIWNYLKAHDNGITNFHFEISADLLSDEAVALLNSLRPGQVQLEIGVQSVNVQTLAAIGRKMDFEKVKRRVLEVVEGQNVHQHLDLIVGLPYEDYDSFKNSFNAVYQLRPQQLQLGFLKVLKGSDMADKAAEYECQYTSKAPYEVLRTKWLGFDEVLKLKQVEEMVEVYYNSAQFEKTIAQIVKLFATPFDFYQTIGAFYEEKRYFDVSHSRMRRYDILLEFLGEIAEANVEYYKELMLFDLYAREKLKKRPQWASEPSRDKQQKDKMIHIEEFKYDLDHEEAILLQEPMKVAFDYSQRNPISRNARHQQIKNIWQSKTKRSLNLADESRSI